MSSTNYQELTTKDEIQRVAAETDGAWKDPSIPRQQFAIVRDELRRFTEGQTVPPFNALRRCITMLPAHARTPDVRLLDVGAASGYYWNILRLSGFDGRYTAVDYSPEFKPIAIELNPEIDYHVGDARALPFKDDEFDIVLSGANILHIRDYGKAVSEVARVAKSFAIFHKTPILLDDPTKYFRKEAYGVPCLEIHFNETELLRLFRQNGLEFRYAVDVFIDEDRRAGHRSYVLSKSNELAYHPV